MLCSGCTRSGGGRRWWVLFPEVHFGESNVWVSSLHCTQRACMLQLAWLPPAGSRLRHPCSNIITKFQMMRLPRDHYTSIPVLEKQYGTLEQNKMGDVAAICAHKNKRTSSKAFRLQLYAIKLIEL